MILNHKPISSFSKFFYTAQMHLANFQKHRIIHTKRKGLSVANLLSAFYTEEELQMNQLKHKELTTHLS